jgi:hypothetical protein
MPEMLMTEDVDIATAKELARYYYKQDIPVFLEGPPGVGKSQVWRQIADEEKVGFADIRLGQKDVVDLTGVPKVVEYLENKETLYETIWARPSIWPREARDGKRGIILFDEMSDINKAMQSAAYEVILDRRCGPHVLPKQWFPCAAGNRRADRAAAQSMSTALANRFAWLSVVPDARAWLDWAIPHGVAEQITSFIRFKNTMLHSMEGSDLRAFPSPRSWTQASKVVDAPSGMRMRLVGGCVGMGAAADLEAFIQLYSTLPPFETVERNPKGADVPTSAGSKYAMSGALSRKANKQNFGNLMIYAQRLGRDFEIVVGLDATKLNNDLTETQAYREFIKRNKDLQF